MNSVHDPGFSPFQMILDRMAEHREASGTRHAALLEGLTRTNEKLDVVVTELSGGNVRFERIEAGIRANALRIAALESVNDAVKNNVLEVIKAIVVPALLSLLSAAAGVFGALKLTGHQ